MKKQELDQRREEALRRYRIIAPLVEENLAESEKRNIRWLIREQEGMSSRTLRRYVAAFKKGGFDALLPRERKDKGVCKAISPEALLMAAELRRELPAAVQSASSSSWREKVIALPARHWNGTCGSRD